MRWEYLQVTHCGREPGVHTVGWLPFVETLNDYGAKGWELIAIVDEPPNSGRRLTFKRPVVDADLVTLHVDELVNTAELRARIAEAVVEGAAAGMKKGGGG